MIQYTAIYAHWAALVIAGIVTVFALVRAARYAPVAQFLIAGGMFAVTGAVFAGENLYADLIYHDSARALPEVRLALFGLGATMVSAGVVLLPGMTPKRFVWLRLVAPILVLIGFGLASGVQRMGATMAGPAALGGLLVVAAGVLPLLDNRESGRNSQSGAASAWGFSLVAAGVLGALGAYFSAGESMLDRDRGALMLAIGEGAFSLFVAFALVSVESVAPVAKRPSASSRRDLPAPPSAGMIPSGPVRAARPPSRAGSALPPPPSR